MQNWTGFNLEAVRRGAVFEPTGNGAVSVIDVRDIAEAAATVLVEPHAHEMLTYTLTSPAALTQAEQIGLISDLTKRRILYVDTPELKVLDALRAQQVPETMIEWIMSLHTVVKNGWAAAISDDLRRLLAEAHAGSKRLWPKTPSCGPQMGMQGTGMNNQIVVITGGATGIGLAIARKLVQHNTVVSIDRSDRKISALNVALPSVVSLKADLTNTDERERVLAEIDERFGRIDLLINNAGVGGEFDFVGSGEHALAMQMSTQITTNYEAPVLLTRGALQLLRRSSAPCVVFNTTGLVYMPMAVVGTYCGSKSALHAVVMALRHQLRPLHIRVVEVLPPSVDTALNTAKNVPKMVPEVFADHFVRALERRREVINVGHSAALERLSRWFPRLAFRMLNPPA